jgi:hypothetical protein
LDLSSSAHVSVSSVFYPTANIGGVPADTLLITADGVWFYVHAYRLAAASGNGFGALVPGPAPPGMPLIVPEASGVLNLVLHTAYGLPFAQFVPSFDELEAAVDALARYGAVDALARYGAVDALARYGAVHLPAVAPMHDALLAQAPLHPLAVYALAGAHGLDALAVASSAYLLTLALATLSDADSIRMGPVYLRRLFFLHLGRCDALKRLLVTGPVGHSSTPTCNVADQTAITRAWALAAAYLSWEARAGTRVAAVLRRLLLGADARPQTCRRASSRARSPRSRRACRACSAGPRCASASSSSCSSGRSSRRRYDSRRSIFLPGPGCAALLSSRKNTQRPAHLASYACRRCILTPVHTYVISSSGSTNRARKYSTPL